MVDPKDLSFVHHDDIRAVEFQLAAFRYREADLIKRLRQAITQRTGRGLAQDDAWNECADLATDVGRAHIERRNFEQFVAVCVLTWRILSTVLYQLLILFRMAR